MVGYIVKVGGVIVEKNSFSGDISEVKAEMDARAISEPLKEFIYFDEDHFHDYEAA